MRKIIPFGILAALLTLLVALPAQAGGPPDGPPGLARAIVAQEAHTDALMAIDGVVGTGVGLGANGRAAVFVLTEEPGVAGIPRTLDGVPVVPQVTGKVVALNKPPHDHATEDGDPPPPTADCSTTEWCPRPVPIGVSTGHPDITAGTIGARVTDGTNVYALSNNHIYAASNNANIGDNVLQPGAYDGGVSPDDDIGTLADFVPIVFSTSASNVIDAAIALSSTAVLSKATRSDGYGTPSSTPATAAFNGKLKKYGRTTGETKGFVWALNVTVNVNYGGPGVARFVQQIMIKGNGTFSAGGDSGSLIVTQRGNYPVGLLFAGSSQFTFANPIVDVLAAFGVTIDGS